MDNLAKVLPQRDLPSKVIKKRQKRAQRIIDILKKTNNQEILDKLGHLAENYHKCPICFNDLQIYSNGFNEESKAYEYCACGYVRSIE